MSTSRRRGTLSFTGTADGGRQMIAQVTGGKPVVIVQLIAQLGAYSAVWWLLFAGIAFVAARLGRGWGILVGHVVIAVVVMALDEQWLQAERRKPGWSGLPDQDVVFAFGVLFRIVLINTILLPVSGVGLMSRGPRRSLGSQSV